MYNESLSEDQKIVVDISKIWWESNRLKTFVITGPGGSGKTMVAKHIIFELKLSYSEVLILAPTSLAAQNLKKASRKDGIEPIDARTVSSILEQPVYYIKFRNKESKEESIVIQRLSDILQKENVEKLGDETCSILYNGMIDSLDGISIPRGGGIMNPDDYPKEFIEFKQVSQEINSLEGVELNISQSQGSLTANELFIETKKGSITIGGINDFDKLGGLLPEKLISRLKYTMTENIERVNMTRLHKLLSRTSQNRFEITRKQAFETRPVTSDVTEKYKLIIVDEAGKLTEEQYKNLKKYKIPMILIGDTNQLGPVIDDDATEKDIQNYAIQDKTNDFYFELTENHRQYGQALAKVSNIMLQLSFNWCNWLINEKPVDEKTLDGISCVRSKKYQVMWTFRPHSVEYLSRFSTILAATNKQVCQYNSSMHFYYYPNDFLGEGEQVRITGNSKEERLPGELPQYINGQYGVITHVYRAYDHISTGGVLHQILQPNDLRKLENSGLALVDIKMEDEAKSRRVLINTYDLAWPNNSDEQIRKRNQADSEETDVRRRRNPSKNSYQLKEENDNLNGRTVESVKQIAEDYHAKCSDIIHLTYAYAITVYSSQGMEFNSVYFDASQQPFASEKRNPLAVPIEIERQQFMYVGVTRAQQRLVIQMNAY